MDADYQLRVINEHQELADKTRKLGVFLTGHVFRTIPKSEQERLYRQWRLMFEYMCVLDERISAFGNPNA